MMRTYRDMMDIVRGKPFEPRWQFRQDQDSHWYMIPDDMVTKWSELAGNDIANDDYCVQSIFERYFNEYRIGGGPESFTFCFPIETARLT